MPCEIRLDALSIRQEVEDLAEFGAIDEAAVEYVENLSDEEIGAMIHEVVDDRFWSVYDDMRSRIVVQLLAQNK